MERNVPRLLIGGVASGVGKTTVTVALARALRARGLTVALFKCGPDYLDPTYHARAVERTSQNLDGWMMGRAAVERTFITASAGADVALIEGMMGLFDGRSPSAEEGSSAEIAKWLETPVCLVLDASGLARSVAALIAGYTNFDPALRVAGAIANRVGGRAHLELLRAAAPSQILGGLPRDDEHAFPERHLGLHSADDTVAPAPLLDHWAEQAERWLDLDRLLALARSAPPLTAADSPVAANGVRCRIGVARDEAFHFYYAENLRLLEAAGAELVPFSPLHDARLPEVDGLYLGGGYPELFGAELSANHSLRAAVLQFARRGAPIYAECGGLMYLTRAIATLDGREHAMVGWLPARARMRDRLQAIGYVEVETLRAGILGPAGSRFRGHQFRYSELEALEDSAQGEPAYALQRQLDERATPEGYRRGNCLASYVHAHWAANPELAAAFVASCARFRAGRAGAS